MIMTSPDAPLAFSIIRPVAPSSTRPVASPQVVPAFAPRAVRRALAAGLAGAAALVVALAL